MRTLEYNNRLLVGLGVLLSVMLLTVQSMASCQSQRVRLQMLGTTGPEIWDGRASTGYLLWLDDKARIVVDAGAGSLQNFARSGADYADLKVFLFSHFHIDHSADFPAYVKGGFFTDRNTDLQIIGPSGNDYLPSAEAFLNRLFDKDTGLYPYLNSFIRADVPSAYKIKAKTVPSSYKLRDVQQVFDSDGIRISAVSVHHGILPALGYWVEMAGCVISFSGDMSGRFQTMPDLAKGSDILVAHNAIPENQTGAGQLLHMKPDYIGKMAAQAGVRQLLLTHLMRRSAAVKQQTLALIRTNYKGIIRFPDDMDSFHP